MTRSKRVLEVLTGLVMFVAGAAFFFSGTESSVMVMLILIQLGMTIRGFRTLFYYFSMARYMVGGKNVLYRSFILLDLGVLAGSLVVLTTALSIVTMFLFIFALKQFGLV